MLFDKHIFCTCLITSSDEELEEMKLCQRLSKEQFIQQFRVSRQVSVELAERFKNSEYLQYQEGYSESVFPGKKYNNVFVVCWKLVIFLEM